MALPVLKAGAKHSTAVTYLKNLLKLELAIHKQSKLSRAVGKSTVGGYNTSSVTGIKWVQKHHKLKADGIVGPATWKILENNIKNAIHGRGSWGAKAPRNPHTKVNWTSKTTTFVHHSVTPEPRGNIFMLSTLAMERAHMRYLQDIAFAREFSDISYSYIIMPSGRIFEGRGKEVLGAHTLGHNGDIGVCFVGNYETDKLTEEQEAALTFLRKTLGVGKSAVRAHCSVYATSCPGKNVRSALNLTCGSGLKTAHEARADVTVLSDNGYLEPQDHEHIIEEE